MLDKESLDELRDRLKMHHENWGHNDEFESYDDDFPPGSLRGWDFRGEDLRGYDFSGTWPEECDFTGADLRDANLDFLEVTNCIFRDADLRGAIIQAEAGIGPFGPYVPHCPYYNECDFTGALILKDAADFLKERGADIENAILCEREPALVT